MTTYTYNDIIIAFQKLGIEKGDNLFIHSNLGFFGRLEGANTADELCGNFLNAFIEVIGEEGSIIVPTFTYSFCHGEVFDVDHTPTKCGIFSEYLRNNKNSVRSEDPNFSITAYGKNKVFYTINPPNESFGKESFWQRFLETNGKIVCMNFDSGSTFVHYVEKQNNVPYRYNKAFNGIIKKGEFVKRDYFVHYVYDYDKPDTAPSFIKLDSLCKENGICKSVNLGRGRINLIEAKKYYELINFYLKIQPNFLTKGSTDE